MTAKLPIKSGTLHDRVEAQREVLIGKIKRIPDGAKRDVLVRRLNKLDLAAKGLSASMDLMAD